jgi:hypothetical protein
MKKITCETKVTKNTKVEIKLAVLKAFIMKGWTGDQCQSEKFFQLLTFISNDVSCEKSTTVETYFSNSDQKNYKVNEMKPSHKTNVLRIFVRDNSVETCMNSNFFFQLVTFLADDICQILADDVSNMTK